MTAEADINTNMCAPDDTIATENASKDEEENADAIKKEDSDAKEEDEKKDDGGAAKKESNTKKYVDWPVRNIKEPHNNDVLYGRGGEYDYLSLYVLEGDS